jgi:hypothetical protein
VLMKERKMIPLLAFLYYTIHNRKPLKFIVERGVPS